jgi:hypothetical protein
LPVDALPVVALPPELLPAALDVPPPEVRALEVRVPDPPPVVRPPDVPPPDVPPPDVPAAEVVVRAEALRGSVFSLVARPASAIPAHPPAHVPEHVVRLSPRCFRERAAPSLAGQIQTDLFPRHGCAMGSGAGITAGGPAEGTQHPRRQASGPHLTSDFSPTVTIMMLLVPDIRRLRKYAMGVPEGTDTDGPITT